VDGELSDDTGQRNLLTAAAVRSVPQGQRGGNAPEAPVSYRVRHFIFSLKTDRVQSVVNIRPRTVHKTKEQTLVR